MHKLIVDIIKKPISVFAALAEIAQIEQDGCTIGIPYRTSYIDKIVNKCRISIPVNDGNPMTLQIDYLVSKNTDGTITSEFVDYYRDIIDMGYITGVVPTINNKEVSPLYGIGTIALGETPSDEYYTVIKKYPLVEKGN